MSQYKRIVSIESSVYIKFHFYHRACCRYGSFDLFLLRLHFLACLLPVSLQCLLHFWCAHREVMTSCGVPAPTGKDVVFLAAAFIFPGPMIFSGIWEVEQWMEDQSCSVCLCLSAIQINKSEKKKRLLLKGSLRFEFSDINVNFLSQAVCNLCIWLDSKLWNFVFLKSKTAKI